LAALGSSVSVIPTVQSSSVHASSGYEFHTVYNHHKKYVYTYTTAYCSPPSASLEVCLSSVFSTIEMQLSSVDIMLKKYEPALKSAMKKQRADLVDEISWVSDVSKIAEAVSSYVDIDNQAIEIQISELLKEKLDVKQAYYAAISELRSLEAEVNEVINEEIIIKSKYEAVKVKKWTLYSAISAIVAEKAVVIQEQGEIQNVMEKLNEEIGLINVKINQLYKRGKWLESWEEKLSVYLSHLQVDIKKFRDIEGDLYKREVSLYSEQEYLLKKIDSAESCIESLYIQYSKIVEEINYIYKYEENLHSVYLSVYADYQAFKYAYEDFTCEDSLLYHEACSSPAVAPAPPAPLAVAAKPKALV
jgi:chromosome segregation ATPase